MDISIRKATEFDIGQVSELAACNHVRYGIGLSINMLNKVHLAHTVYPPCSLAPG